MTVLLLVATAIWVLSPHPPLQDQLTHQPDRIAVASLLIELATVVAFTLAAVEFWLSQRGPNLRVLLSRAESIQPTEKLTFESRSQGADSLSFRFLVLLDNAGPVAGRWIKIRISVRMFGGMQTPGLDRLYLVAESNKGGWEQEDEFTYTFLGKDGYLSYPRPRRVEDLREWVDVVGDFSLIARNRAEEPYTMGPIARVVCSVWADRFTRLNQIAEVWLGEAMG